MQLYSKNNLFVIFLSLYYGIYAQNQVKDTTDFIHILYADHAVTSNKYPGKQLLSGDVQIQHNGAFLYCDKAIVDKKENTAIAVGNVLLKQGDTVSMRAGYIKYNGNDSFAEAYDNVILTDPKMNLHTDTLYLDRKKQISYYTTGGIIRDSVNTLTSKIGKYFLNDKRFRFINNVHINNPDYQIDSYRLDYFTETGISDFFGPTKIYNEQSYIYAEKGHYDSQKDISWFVKNAFIKHKHTSIKADSLYYDRKKEYATGNRHVVVFDSINNTWIFADYAQRWAKLDSTRVSQKPLVVSVSEKDTLYMRARQIITAGKENRRKLWAYPKVRFFSNDFSGKADSLFRSDRLKTMKLMKKPVLWSNKSQITGTIILLKNDSLNKLDSLIIPQKVFIIQKDSIGYNQIKGKKLLGKIKDGHLKTIDIYGNTEVIYYLREDNGQLTGIEKNKSSHIYIEFEQGKIALIRLYDKPEGIIYPYQDFPEKEKYFKGFNWRGNEQITSKKQLTGTPEPVFEAQSKQMSVYQQEEIIDNNMRLRHLPDLDRLPNKIPHIRPNKNKKPK